MILALSDNYAKETGRDERHERYDRMLLNRTSNCNDFLYAFHQLQQRLRAADANLGVATSLSARDHSG